MAITYLWSMNGQRCLRSMGRGSASGSPFAVDELETVIESGLVQHSGERVPANPVGGRHPALLLAGKHIHPLFGPRFPPVACRTTTWITCWHLA